MFEARHLAVKILFPIMIITVITYASCIATPTPVQQSVDNKTNVQTETQPEKLYAVIGTVFHDYNGDGLQESVEPSLDGIKLTYMPGDYSCFTDSDGKGSVNIPAGRYNVYINDTSVKFRYILTSISEITPIAEGLKLTIDEDKHVPVPLAEGFLTMPFPTGITETGPRSYVSINAKGDIGRDWRNNLGVRADHLGTDFLIPQNTLLLAAAPGIIVYSNYVTEDGNTVTIKHPDGNLTIYCHLEARNVKYMEHVNRGDIIGISGHTGAFAGLYPHLHFQFGGFGISRLDPYRDVADPSSFSWWTKDNDPQYFK